jgi:hypothetical protein
MVTSVILRTRILKAGRIIFYRNPVMIHSSKEGTNCLLEEGTTTPMEEDTDDSSEDRVLGNKVC